MTFGTKILRFIKKKFYPPRCIFCRSVMEDGTQLCLCRSCAAKVSRIPSERCPVCGLVTPLGSNVCWECASKKIYFKSHKSPYFYENEVRRSLLRFKFYGKAHYAKTMGIIMASYIPYDVNIDYITWVPMTVKQIKARGYNQSKLLAKSVSEYSSGELKELLFKVKSISKQSRLNAAARASNIKGAFSCGEDLNGKNILLVDDIYTTGSTLNECSKVLKHCGANEIYCLTFASTRMKK
ncbi:MAG: ComF family protein [Clostridia bacterium]|nr:ComF family protein [Clostridia bacterium]